MRLRLYHYEPQEKDSLRQGDSLFSTVNKPLALNFNTH